MSVTLTIDGKRVTVSEGTTILRAAADNGIKIPNLCYDGRVELYGACGLCVVEVEGVPKLLRACSAKVTEGMAVHTQSERITSARKVALELLMSDHEGDCVAPCSKACPAGTDCQGYVGLIANGEYREAVKLIKEKLPIPASIGRICPHPCEQKCRRQFVDEPISIANLKAFVADKNLEYDTFVPEIEPDSGKSVAVIGGGPAGLTAAYFLRAMGHSVTIFDQMPKMGGMLRYGIPEYRLPKKVLDSEIALIADMGVKLRNNVKIGADVTLDSLKQQYDAVLVAIGAWNSSKMRVEGEDLEGVWGGIDFLREVALGNSPKIGKSVAVCGGGNTAMDACRTAVRLGAETVYVIYRRTKDEMPADEQEILESEEEGVIYKYLTNPIRFTGENGKLSGALLQKMRLGDPDDSGRRRPEPIPGETEKIALDSVIMAIGQYPNLTGFEQLAATKRGTVAADESRFTTDCEGVFAVGDATNKGADIAIAAIGEAQKASVVIDRYLNGETVGYKKPYYVERSNEDIDFTRFEKQPRVKMPQIAPAVRKSSFDEVNLGFTEEQAKKEAMRCLECGCHDYYECKLISYANDYSVKPARFNGEKHKGGVEDKTQLISRNSDKCILCGLCVRVCDEVMGKTALGLINRGFNTVIEPELNKPLGDTDCIMCGMCVDLCPTGALREKSAMAKSVPVKESSQISVCTGCNALCETDYRFIGSTPIRAVAPEGKILCKGGKFGVLDYKKSTADTEGYNRQLALLGENTGDSLAVLAGGGLSAEILVALKAYAKEKNAKIYTDAPEYSASMYALKALGFETAENMPKTVKAVLSVNSDYSVPDAVTAAFSRNGRGEAMNTAFSENGTYFDKYGNMRTAKGFLKPQAPDFAQYINSLLADKIPDLTETAIEAVNAEAFGEVSFEDVINSPFSR